MEKSSGYRYTTELKLAAIELIEEGQSFKTIAAQLDISIYSAKDWCMTYKAVGREGLLNMGNTKKHYDYETKLAAVQDHIINGATKQEVMVKYEIASPSAFTRWCRIYREQGISGLRPKQKGRHTGSRTLSQEEQSSERIRRLEAENAYLKKVQALKAQKSRAQKSAR